MIYLLAVYRLHMGRANGHEIDAFRFLAQGFFAAVMYILCSGHVHFSAAVPLHDCPYILIELLIASCGFRSRFAGSIGSRYRP